jgi:hypothetical protein
MQPRLQEDHPNLPFNEISQIILEKWSNLPSKEKQQCNDMEICDLARLNNEMQQYQTQQESVIDKKPSRVSTPM